MKKTLKKVLSLMLALAFIVCLAPQNIKAANNEGAGADYFNATQINIGTTYTYHGYKMTDCNDDYTPASDQDNLYFKFDVTTKGEYQFKLSEGHGFMYESNLYLYDNEYNQLGSKIRACASTEKMTITLDAGTYYLRLYAGSYTRGDLKISFVDSKKPYINLSKTTMTVGDKASLSIKNKPSETITWISGKESVATVNSEGKVTAKKEGKAVIFAIIDNKSYKCTVTVKK